MDWSPLKTAAPNHSKTWTDLLWKQQPALLLPLKITASLFLNRTDHSSSLWKSQPHFPSRSVRSSFFFLSFFLFLKISFPSFEPLNILSLHVGNHLLKPSWSLPISIPLWPTEYAFSMRIRISLHSEHNSPFRPCTPSYFHLPKPALVIFLLSKMWVFSRKSIAARFLMQNKIKK